MVRNKKAVIAIALITLVALYSFAALTVMQVAKASPNPIVVLDPAEVVIPFCETRDIAICIENFTDLRIFEFKIWWIKEAVNYTGYEWKPLPPEWPEVVTPGPAFDENETHRAVRFGIAALIPFEPFSYLGRWPFIDIYWHCIKPGVDTPLIFDREVTRLADEEGLPIPIEQIIDGFIINSELYWKENHTDYAPSGVPDFDQRQDAWVNPSTGAWSWCGPTAVANSLWWMDSRFETSITPPPAINDTFPLVQSYDALSWDDHDPQNVQPFIVDLSWLMDTDGQRTGLQHNGTNIMDMQAGIAQYMSLMGVNPLGDANGDGMVSWPDVVIVVNAYGAMPGGPGWDLRADLNQDNRVDMLDVITVCFNWLNVGIFYEKTVKMPSFEFVEYEVEKCEDVILLLGFWQWNGTDWIRIGGHYVTVVGVDSVTKNIVFSDPIQDMAEANNLGPPYVPVPHPSPHGPTVHNNASLVSHDPYTAAESPSPGGIWGPAEYETEEIYNFISQNFPEEFESYAGNYTPGQPVATEVEYAVIISPTEWYWKPPQIDYGPFAYAWWSGDRTASGVPDFDERQWGTYNWTDPWGAWSHCGPVACANSLWWLDSEHETGEVPPPEISDSFPLVQSYNTTWDDHDPQNVPHVIQHLAWLMDTDGQRTGVLHSGTNVLDMEVGIAQYLSWTGLNPEGDANGDGRVNDEDLGIVESAFGSVPGGPNWNLAADLNADNTVDSIDLSIVTDNYGNSTGKFYEKTVKMPSFEYIESEIEKCEDVILLLGFWQPDTEGFWWRIGGHYVTAVGVDSTGSRIAISDPGRDQAEQGAPPGGFPGIAVPPYDITYDDFIINVHNHTGPPETIHNNATWISHDIFNVGPSISPGGEYALIDYYPDLGFLTTYVNQNFPEEFLEYYRDYIDPNQPVYVEIEYAVVVSFGLTLTITENNGGTTEPSPGTYTYPLGAIATVTATPYPWNIFSHWELDGSGGYSNPISVTMDSDHTLRAVFKYPRQINRLMELYSATIEGASPETVDPAWCYDTASAELIFNVYETLVFFDGECTDTYIPQLATEWTVEDITGTISPEGLDWYFRYIFKIRTGVAFHGGDWGAAGYYTLSPADVEYSFERGMVQDRDGGPQLMLYEPLLDTWGADGLGDLGNPEDIVRIGKMIDHAVESNETHVWFNLAFPGAYAPYLQILSQSWAGILSRQCVNEYVIGTLGRPEWPGEWGDYSNWVTYHNPTVSPLDDPSPVMCGTGPFYFDWLDYISMFWSVARFPEYWRGWPADWPAPPYPSTAIHPTPAGYADRIKVTWAFTWETRRDMFLAGDVDFCAVPREYNDQVLDEPGIRCTYPLPALQVSNLFYNFNISLGSPYGPINPPGEFNEDAIPSDFFGNASWGVHTRKAFSYAFDYETYLAQAFLGEAVAPATAIIPGLICYDPTVEGYEYDLAKAETEFKAVPSLWDTGFTISLAYNTGNMRRYWACFYLKQGIDSLNNTKFHVNLIQITYVDYLVAMINDWVPTFIMSWLADYPDPHNFAFLFYHSQGTFAEWQGYNNPTMDDLINEGIRESDPDLRCDIYHDIQVLAVNDCPSVPIVQPVGRHFERDWVVGWYYNPISPGIYSYNLWKWYYVPFSKYATVPPADPPYSQGSNMLPEDINYDGMVDMTDLGFIGMAYGAAYGPPPDPQWSFRCDVYNDRLIDMTDLGFAAMDYGQTSATWTPPP